MKDKDLIKERILKENDFIHSPRLGNSLERMIEKYPDGLDDKQISRVLMLTLEELEEYYESALMKLRKALGVKNA